MQNVFAGARRYSLVVPSDTVEQPTHQDIRANADGIITLVSWDGVEVSLTVVTGEKLNHIAKYIKAGSVACTLMDWSA